MIQSLELSIITLMATTAMTMLILFLPAFIELKKPKDGGPRMITHLDRANVSRISIANMEEEQSFDGALLMKIASLVSVIPNLEV